MKRLYTLYTFAFIVGIVSGFALINIFIGVRVPYPKPVLSESDIKLIVTILLLLIIYAQIKFRALTWFILDITRRRVDHS